ncbi:MAG: hypothetical protein RLZZ15_4413 [Verrucomicrobiota bacterium]
MKSADALLPEGDRWLAALADLASREATELRASDLAAVLETQKRIAPLVEALAAHGRQRIDADFRGRIAAVIARRTATLAALAEEIQAARETLAQNNTAHRRLTRLAPVYGGHANNSPRLSVTG